MIAFWDILLPKYGKCITISQLVVPDIVMSGRPSMLAGAGWYMFLVFLMLIESPRL